MSNRWSGARPSFDTPHALGRQHSRAVWSSFGSRLVRHAWSSGDQAGSSAMLQDPLFCALANGDRDDRDLVSKDIATVLDEEGVVVTLVRILGVVVRL
jgi:hypothetical protein